MVFLRDIIIPDSIHSFIINKKYTITINRFFDKHFIGSLYVYGPRGCGKYTLVIKQLEKLVDKKIRLKNISVDISDYNYRDIDIQSSSYHFEISINKYNQKKNIIHIIEILSETKPLCN